MASRTVSAVEYTNQTTKQYTLPSTVTRQVLLEQQWSKGKWKERLATRLNAFPWKNSYSRSKQTSFQAFV